MFGLSWMLGRRNRRAIAMRPSPVSRGSHQSDTQAMRDEGYSIIEGDALIARDGQWYIKKEVQQALIDKAVSDTRAGFIRELALPITFGTIIRSIHEIKLAK